MPQASSANILIRLALIVSVFLAVTFSIQSAQLSESLEGWTLSSTLQDEPDGAFGVFSANHSNATHFQFCKTPTCWQSLARSLGLVRAFPDRHDQEWLVLAGKSSEPLIDLEHNRTYSNAGILYVKNFKAASSTAAGVALRLAHRLPAVVAGNNHTTAWVRFHHTPGWTYRDRHPNKSFLFTSIRDPARRALSRIFYTQISQDQREPNNDEFMLSCLRDTDAQFGSVRHTGGGYQVWYTSMEGDQLPRSWGAKRPTTVQKRPVVEDAVRKILESYDFLMIAERLDESVVVMALLMNVSLDDVLVQNAKDSSANAWYYFKRGKIELCRKPVQVVQSPAVREHLQADEWIAKNYGDYLLQAAGHLSLDATIQRLGPERVNRALQAYRMLQDQVGQACRNQTIYHCSADGTPQRALSRSNCYSDDSGCGYPCIDAFLTRLPTPRTERIF